MPILPLVSQTFYKLPKTSTILQSAESKTVYKTKD